MKDYEIKEGDIVEIDYIDEFTKEHINEGEALVLWRGFNHQPLVHFPPSDTHKLDKGITIWSSYDRITRVVGHVDIERYMEDAIALAYEPYASKGTREEAIERLKGILAEATETDNAVCYVTSDDADALRVAIKALEQEPCVPQEPKIDFDELKRKISDSIDECISECRGREDKEEQENDYDTERE